MPNAQEASCVFCKIVSGEIQSKKLLDSENCIAISDLNPQAPTHLLVIPKDHYSDITQCQKSNLLGELFSQASALALKHSLNKGFRLVVNTGNEGGQTVHHLHIHVLGGRFMGWPPG
ncbi:MAG: histidine triad nucleotide-binding protein [Candidatus Melainabacteria bacterium]|nr:MAG: histidine triad nucleotide-binding protein [Candidatus Melainabacteria bacterium]